MKQYIGFSRDHSGSMSSIASAAKQDYNTTIQAIKNAAVQENIDTIVTVVKCGVGRNATVDIETVNSSILTLQPLTEQYEASGNATPLFESVGKLIELLQNVPDANDPNVSFLVQVTTDGQNNTIRNYTANMISSLIKKLQATDRWTFVFRVPRGYKNALTSLGIPEGNIQEWDQTVRGIEVASVATQSAYSSFFAGRTAGVRSSKGFYTTNMTNVDAKVIKKSLSDITDEATIWKIAKSEDGSQIRDFCESRLKNMAMEKGAAFYQLTKTEREVQDYKIIIIRDQKTQKLYAGRHARDLLGLPTVGTIKIVPGDHSDYDIFIQSTSVNRKLVAGTELVYWKDWN